MDKHMEGLLSKKVAVISIFEKWNNTYWKNECGCLWGNIKVFLLFCQINVKISMKLHSG
jgi:hypothetical protein